MPVTRDDFVAAVRVVACWRDPDEPEALTQQQFDRLKQRLDYGGLAPAAVIARKLGKPWREVVRYAADGTRGHGAYLCDCRDTA